MMKMMIELENTHCKGYWKMTESFSEWVNIFFMSLILWQCWSHCCLPFFCHFVNWFSQKFNGRLVRPVCLFKFWLFADFEPASKSCHFLPGAEIFCDSLLKNSWYFSSKWYHAEVSMMNCSRIMIFWNYSFSPFFCIWSRQYFSLIVEPRHNRIAEGRNFPKKN